MSATTKQAKLIILSQYPIFKEFNEAIQNNLAKILRDDFLNNQKNNNSNLKNSEIFFSWLEWSGGIHTDAFRTYESTRDYIYGT